MKAFSAFLSGALLMVLVLFPRPAVAAQSGTLVSSLPHWCAQCDIPILMYHYVRVNPNPKDKLGEGLSVTPAAFDHQLDAMQKAGYVTVSFESIAKNLPLPPKPIILTFDDGYEDAYTDALPALKKYGMTATFFIVSGFIGKPHYLTHDELLALKDAGMELGAHTRTHIDLSKASLVKQRSEIRDSVEFLRKQMGVDPVYVFAYPSGKYRQMTKTLVKNAGVPFAVTTHIGIANGESLPLELPRERVNSKTDIIALLSGHHKTQVKRR